MSTTNDLDVNEFNNALFAALDDMLSGEYAEAGKSKSKPKCSGTTCDELLKQLKECRDNECKVRDKLEAQAINEGTPLSALTLHPDWDEQKARETTSAEFIQFIETQAG